MMMSKLMIRCICRLQSILSSPCPIFNVISPCNAIQCRHVYVYAVFFSLRLYQDSDGCNCFRSNININDVLGDYMLTIVDSLDSLAVSNPIANSRLYVGSYVYFFLG